MTNTKICGVEIAAIRKAYFSHQIPQLLDDIQQKEELTQENIAELDAFLATLEAERKAALDAMKQRIVLDPNKLALPSVDELMAGDRDEERHKERLKLIATAREKVIHILNEHGQAAQSGASNPNKMKEDLLVVEQLRSLLDQDRVLKDQAYRARMIQILDGYGCSRKEAEERAKITPEYREYKLAILFAENIESWVMSAKKRIGSAY